MASKKNKTASGKSNLQALRIGSRVRCADDGVEGRIVWANAISVKIKWDDGEQVTWKRDSLAERPIAILDPDEEGRAEAPAAEEAAAVEVPRAEPEATAPEAAATEPAAPAPEPLATESAPPAPEPAGTEPATPKRQRRAPAAPKGKKVSALDAAAKVLAEEGRPMSCQELIGAMAAKGYWTSPGGQTPSATLYSAILRELATKGDQARFTKVGRGQFAYRAEG